MDGCSDHNPATPHLPQPLILRRTSSATFAHPALSPIMTPIRHTISGTLESVANELSYRVSLTSQGAAKELTYDRRRRMLPLWRWDEIRYSKHRKYRKYVRRMLPLWRWEEVG